jgi:RND family efflux transporter MFP subunit
MKVSYYLYMLLVVACSACGDRQSDPAAEELGHSHGEGSVPITAFSDSCEYFAEVEPMVKGSSSVASVHITRLSTYRPLAEGTLTVNVFRNGRLVGSGTTNKPRIAGIFPVTFTPGESGAVSLQFRFAGGGLTDSVLVPSAVVYPDRHEAELAPLPEEPAGAIRFTKEMAWKTDFRVLEIVPQDLSSTLKVTGELILRPADIETINAASDGILSYGRSDLVPGAMVTKGTLLYSLTGRGLTSRNLDAHVSALKSSFESAKAAFERERALLKDQVVSLKQFNETTARYRNDSIRYFTYLGTMTGQTIRVESPVSGYIQAVYTPNGSFVSEGAPLIAIGRSAMLMLRADLPQRYWNEAPLIRSASFRLAGSRQVYHIDDLGGRLVAKGQAVATGSPFMPVTFEFANRFSLVAGSLAEVYLHTTPLPCSISVPASAMLEEQGNFYIFVQAGGESFVKRGITPGFTDGENTLVKTGLVPGERIVARGAMLIKAASQMNGTPSHGHEH